ncbi:superinfection immunity protein [Geodermatophilus sabuli]|uniref:Superinfection immunity protein n=1 Tax=Geodermatophilus sabuli TaxID=1564158 RepID=A0A7K3W5R8_9ACTN|nr:superinfection immunity protein [Geodermatophilus sabuli]NEK60225.1 superinfection immunity protein [Geodermatophilus sabuli]
MDIYAATSDDGSGALLILLLIAGGFYLLPTIIAFTRRVPDRGSVAVINVLLGWSLIGWVVSLAMASRSVPSLMTGMPVIIGAHGYPTTGSYQPQQNAGATSGGWWPDPSATAGVERYFDGQQWTNRTRPAAS